MPRPAAPRTAGHGTGIVAGSAATSQPTTATSPSLPELQAVVAVTAPPARRLRVMSPPKAALHLLPPIAAVT